jgi:hypothetical protein
MSVTLSLKPRHTSLATVVACICWSDRMVHIADLDSLTETEIKHDGKRFVVRSAPRSAASLALRAAGVALPPTVREAAAAR